VGEPLAGWLTGDICPVVNGLLPNVCSQIWRGGRFLGDAGKDATRFPLLIKFFLGQAFRPGTSDDEGAAEWAALR
jgi:hypothetical protein